MDAATAERINNLAKNLKDLHLASSTEDALSKAREIILGTQGSGKPIKEMMVEAEAVKEAQTVQKMEEAAIEKAEEIKETVSEVKEAQTKVELNNAELAEEAAKVSAQLQKHQHELAKIRQEIEEAKAALDEAKRTKEQFERQIPDMTIKPQAAQPVQQERPRPTLSEEDKKKSDLSRIFNFGKR